MTAALEPFAETDQKRRADRLGMFVFLASEVMLFGGLFAALAVYRVAHPGAAAQASAELNLWLATANTAILLTSSLFAALAVVTAQGGQGRVAAVWLALTALFGLAFLVLKAVEYHEDYAKDLLGQAAGKPQALFVGLYLVATVLHAVHLTVGIVLVAWASLALWRRRWLAPERAMTVEVIGLYWHLVDIIWIFLFPLLYLARPS